MSHNIIFIKNYFCTVLSESSKSNLLSTYMKIGDDGGGGGGGGGGCDDEDGGDITPMVMIVI